jgi:GTP-binding protein
MQDYLRHHLVPTLVVATKIDKLPRSKLRENVERIAQALGLQESAEVIPFSALTQDGKRELWGAIASFLNSEDEQPNSAEFSR